MWVERITYSSKRTLSGQYTFDTKWSMARSTGEKEIESTPGAADFCDIYDLDSDMLSKSNSSQVYFCHLPQRRRRYSRIRLGVLCQARMLRASRRNYEPYRLRYERMRLVKNYVSAVALPGQRRAVTHDRRRSYETSRESGSPEAFNIILQKTLVIA